MQPQHRTPTSVQAQAHAAEAQATPALLSRHWSDWNTADLSLWLKAHGEQAIAVLPVSATEQHGPHLPLSVDSDLAQFIVNACAAQLPESIPALFLPVQCVGYSPEHAAFAGTLTLKSSTVLALWTDLAESLARSGVRKLLILNTHGGQAGLLDVVARDCRARLQMLAVSSNWYDWPLLDAQGREVMQGFSAHERRFGSHAGQVETAMMLAGKPERVQMARAEAFSSSSEQRAATLPVIGNGKSARLAWQAQDLNPQGAVGNAAAANAEQGQTLIDAAARSLTQLLADLHALPIETLRT